MAEVKLNTSGLYITTLRINPVEKTDEKIYKCDLVRRNEMENHIRANYTVIIHEPNIRNFENTNMLGMQSNYTINAKSEPLRIIFKCYADGMLKPFMSWEKDGMKMVMSTTPQTIICNVQIFNESRELHIDPSDRKCSGEYHCEAENNLDRTRQNQTLKIEKLSDSPVEGKLNQTTHNIENGNSNNDAKSVEQPFINISDTRIQLILSVIFIPILFLVVLFSYCTFGKEERKRKVIDEETAPQFLQRISAGLPTPAELLHQDDHILAYIEDKWKYPFKNLFLHENSGNGNFGVFVNARARNILDVGEDTKVAAKTIDNYSFSEARALAIELRILANLDKHPNIVNFLGACPRNLPDIWILLEHCDFCSLYANIKKYKLKLTNKAEIVICDKKDPRLGRIAYEGAMDALESSNNTGRSSDYELDADGNLMTPKLHQIY